MPQPLVAFCEADWSEWLLDGPDPAQADLNVPLEEWYAPPHPVTREVFCGTGSPPQTQTTMVGIGDRPHLVAAYRRYDARRRWREAKRAWLEAHGHPDLAFDAWIDDVVNGRRELQRDLAASG